MILTLTNHTIKQPSRYNAKEIANSIMEEYQINPFITTTLWRCIQTVTTKGEATLEGVHIRTLPSS